MQVNYSSRVILLAILVAITLKSNSDFTRLATALAKRYFN